MTLSQLQASFQALVAEYPYSSYVSVVLGWLNEAQRKVAEKNLITCKSTTPSVASEDEYDLPDDFIAIKRGGVMYDGVKIDPITLDEVAALYGNSWASLDAGTPKYYIIDGGSIQLVPAPLDSSKNIELTYWGYANDLVNSTDVPFTTGDGTVGYTKNNRLRSLDDLLVEYAVAMAKYSLGFYDSTQAALTNFYSMLNSRVRELQRNADLERNEKKIDPFLLRVWQTRQYTQ
jgi:hypothetical protein